VSGGPGHTRRRGPDARWALPVALLLLGCAHATGADGRRRDGASVVVSTTLGARQGELFAVDAHGIWLCQDGAAVRVPKAQLVSAVAPIRAWPLDVAQPEGWAGLARHPEGLPPGGASCGVPHEDEPVALLAATTQTGRTVEGPLLEVSRNTVMLEVAHVPICLQVNELRSLKVRVTHYGPERQVPAADPQAGASGSAPSGVAGLGGAGAAAALLLPVFILVVATAAVVGAAHVAEEDPGSFANRTSLADIDLRRVETLAAFSRYPGGAPPVIRCAPLLPPADLAPAAVPAARL
jgi:hypothetical protein